MALLAPDSEVDICNLALHHLKQQKISSVDDPTTQVEQVCADFYHQIRQERLRSHPWNFASKRTTLTPDATAPEFGFSHRYLLPSDWLRYLGRYDSLGNRVGVADDYDLEGRYYLFNGEDGEAIYLRYTSDFTDVTKMDPLFRGLFAIDLAIVLAPKFSGTENRVKVLLEIRKDLETRATAIDGQERPPRRRQESAFINARRRGRSGYAGPYTEFSG